MLKPYLKKYATFLDFTIWIVDGIFIRNNIDSEFTNFGHCYTYNYIPEKEMWIDREYSKDDEKEYYLKHLLVENELMAEGFPYKTATEIASRIEKRLRKKDLESISRKTLLKNFKINLLKKYSKNGIKVWIVNGKLVRYLFKNDFTAGGHDKIYSFIPKNEIWIEDDIGSRERKFELLHELYERNLMIKNNENDSSLVWRKAYLPAHNSALKIEFFYRNHPEGIDEKIKEELALLKNLKECVLISVNN